MMKHQKTRMETDNTGRCAMQDITDKVFEKIYEIFDGLERNNFKTLGMS